MVIYFEILKFGRDKLQSILTFNRELGSKRNHRESFLK